jgi:hypothetical protein
MEAQEIDKELEDLDTRIDQLRALYEQYFMGIERLEPQKPRQEVERRLKVLRKEQIRNTAQRFKFNVLVQRFNTMQQYWGRVTREIENGTFKRDVIKAAARFGDGALTGVSKKRAKELAKVAALQAKRSFDDAMELGAEDLIEDDEEIDEVPTPPKPGDPGYPAAARGLAPGDLPVVQAAAGYAQPAAYPPDVAAYYAQYGAQPPHATPESQHAAQYQQHATAESQYYQQQQYPQYAHPQQPATPDAQYAQHPQYTQHPQYAQPQPPQYAQPPYAQPPQYAQPQPPEHTPRRLTPLPPAPPAPAPQPQIPAASPSGGSRSGLRWGSSDPSSSIRTAPTDVKRRVAELAAEMRAPRGAEGSGGGFGALDLDFDESPSGRRTSDPGTPAPRSPAAGRPLPAAVPPPRGSSPGARPAVQPPPAATSGFGVLDIALDGDPMPPAPSPSSPGSGIRMGGRPLPSPATPSQVRAQQPAPQPAARPQPQQPRPPQQPAPSAPAAGGDMGEARLRQIYAKYVETKRSANESTAGVTYEKLAATLRAQTEKLKAQHPSKAIDFDVVVKDGKTHLKPVLK